MPTNAPAAAGVYARLAIGAAGSPTTYTFLANCISDIQAGGSTKMVDVTPHGPSNWTQMFPTLNTWGPIDITVAFVAGSTGDGSAGMTSGLGSVWSNNVLREYSLTFPDGTVWYWAAYISKFVVKSQVNGIIEAAVTFDPLGEPILA